MAGENVRAAVRLYAERFPERERHPGYNVILGCVQRARETGSLMPNWRNAGAPLQRRVVDEERILQIFEDFEDDPENPQRRPTIRRVAGMLGLSQSVVHRVLRQDGLHPYHYQRVQQLLARDAEQRIYYCEGFLAQCRRNALFPDRILWTDEATFTPNGVFNSHNFLSWRGENPHAIRQGAFQYRWSINVWAGIKANRIIGPYILPPRLTGEVYARFLEHELPGLLEDVPLREREELIFQHDGAPAHFSRQARNVLDARYPGRWMGRGGPIIWPARSPDLNVLDYFVWGYIKDLVEHRRGGTEAEVREEILAAFGTITPEMAHRSTRNIIRRAELCIREGGRHFEQFLH
ncbi:uncharacterized protein [Temnothorax longispinosus]|uniref:uncharacterized protein n=1 Tax=Temnothorax longispinosus TaxID=300112 RepID=UPI003A9A5749